MLARAPATAGLAEVARALPVASVALKGFTGLWAHPFSSEGTSKPTASEPADSAEAAGVAAADAAMSASATANAAAASATGAADLGDYHTFLPRVVCFGGNGYVGSRVCQQALSMGAAVVSINRSGRPRNLRGQWVDQVEWVQGDALDPQQPWREVLRGASGVVSTMGAFGSNEHMYKICGESNMRVVDAVVQAAVPRFAFISVHDYKFPGGWHAQDFLLRGYFQGKRDAEKYMEQRLPGGGVALRPGFIYGTRAMGSTNLHLGWVGLPLKAALSMLPTRTLSAIPIMGAAFVPPVSVDAVAKAAVSAVLDPTVPPGIMDVWDIGKYE